MACVDGHAPAAQGVGSIDARSEAQLQRQHVAFRAPVLHSPSGRTLVGIGCPTHVGEPVPPQGSSQPDGQPIRRAGQLVPRHRFDNPIRRTIRNPVGSPETPVQSERERTGVCLPDLGGQWRTQTQPNGERVARGIHSDIRHLCCLGRGARLQERGVVRHGPGNEISRQTEPEAVGDATGYDGPRALRESPAVGSEWTRPADDDARLTVHRVGRFPQLGDGE